jgi:hypothetical protein
MILCYLAVFHTFYPVNYIGNTMGKHEGCPGPAWFATMLHIGLEYYALRFFLGFFFVAWRAR